MPSAAQPHHQIPVFDLQMEQEDLDAAERALRSGWISGGPHTKELESEFASRLGVGHVVALSSCTAALHLAYLAAGIGPGDEVIVPSFTFAATASAVRYCGARPVFADVIGLHNPSLDPAEIARRVTPRTKAVCVVHFAGYAAPVDEIAAVCDDLGLALIEDAAHTPSASLAGRKLGTFGLAGAFSLFSNKVLAVGEGGLLATDDEDVARAVRLRRSHCMTRGSWEKHQHLADGYEIDDLGYNYRFDDVRSAICLSRLGRLEAEIESRRQLVLRYRELLGGLEEISIPFTYESVLTSSAYAMPIFLRDAALRDDVRHRLVTDHGIQTTVFYPAIHRFTAFERLYGRQDLPTTELAADSVLVLPLFTKLTVEQQDTVIDALVAELRR